MKEHTKNTRGGHCMMFPPTSAAPAISCLRWRLPSAHMAALWRRLGQGRMERHINAPVAEESVAGARYYLAAALTSGTLGYRVEQ